MLGKAVWDSFNEELDLRGQQMTIVESTGGIISRSIASKAWKAAAKMTYAPRPTSNPRSRNGPGRDKPDKDPLPCYWCNEIGHEGRKCPKKLAGQPFHPKSRAAQWPDHRLTIVKSPKVKPGAGGIRIEKR